MKLFRMLNVALIAVLALSAVMTAPAIAADYYGPTTTTTTTTYYSQPTMLTTTYYSQPQPTIQVEGWGRTPREARKMANQAMKEVQNEQRSYRRLAYKANKLGLQLLETSPSPVSSSTTPSVRVKVSPALQRRNMLVIPTPLSYQQPYDQISPANAPNSPTSVSPPQSKVTTPLPPVK